MGDPVDLSEITHIEKGLLANRPALETVNDGSWVWRFANGFTGRANSLQALDRDDDLNFKARLTAHWRRSRQKGIVERFRVTPLTPPKIIEFLMEQGFKRRGNTYVMTLSGLSVSVTERPDFQVEEHPVTDPNWQKQILALENIGEKDTVTFIQLLEKLPASSVGLSLVNNDGSAIGAAYASCQNGVGSVFALEVISNQRGRGFGRLLMNYLNVWLGKNGAERVALQVVVDNKIAVGLYNSVGFEEIYRYYYLEKNS
ncbi:MAG: GNAT family N-acetyltransferase [Devosiaceae bacterium]|nr:GNAT family N-acetyltransferase [Devosiaceae bacterium]